MSKNVADALTAEHAASAALSTPETPAGVAESRTRIAAEEVAA
jgi:hypothetical protein